MHIGLIISCVLHAAVLGWAIFTIHSQPQLRVPEPEPVAVDLVTPAEMTRLRQGVRTAKNPETEAKEAPKVPEVVRKEAPKPTPIAPKEVAKAEPPKPEPPKPEVKPEPPKEVAKAEPAKDPIAEKLATDSPDPALEQAKLEEKLREERKKAEEQKKLDEHKKLEEQKKAAELKKKREEEAKKRKEAEDKKKKEEEAKKLAEAKKKFDAENIAALLNKTPDKGAPLATKPTDEPTKAKGPVLGAPEGRDKQLSASEIAILGQIIRTCVQSKWNVLGGGETAQHTEVKMRLRFNPDGRLAAEPQVTNHQDTPYFLAVSDSAMRAVKACEPFPLPPPKYEFWRDMILTFRPGDMF